MVFEASAPGRCGIIGNPSDIYGGVVVSCSVPARARCRLTLGADGPPPEDPRLWHAALRRLPVSGVSVQWQTDIPRSSGLSGSTALLAATLGCLAAARGENFEDRTQFAEFVRDVERYDADIACGYQDAYMIVHGGMQVMDFAGKHPVDSGPPANIEPLASPLPFVLVTTGVQRLSGSVHAPMSERWLRGERAVVDGMRRVAELGRLGAAAIRNGNWDRLAELMEENHGIVASLGGSGDEVDALVRLCKEEGALAAKLAGAGHGGTVIALTHDPGDLERRLTAKGCSRFLRPSREAGLTLH